MKSRAKILKVLPFVLLIVFWVLLDFYLDRKSEHIPPGQDLMASMQIVKARDKAKAPDFTLKNLKGENIRLSNLRGKVVLVNFWTTW